MKLHSGASPTLAHYVDGLQEMGRYAFTREEAQARCALSPDAAKVAAFRLQRKRRLVMPRRGFYVSVPLEYRLAGAPPPAWYIDALMRAQKLPYYVGLLSAAAIHGAAHQQPQAFQVLCGRALRPTSAGRSRLEFYFKGNLESTATVAVKVETGTMLVSSPEATVFDLPRYPLASGGLGNIATVLGELAERLDAQRLVEAAECAQDIAAVQRAGFLLDLAGGRTQTGPLAEWVEQQHPRTIRLRPGAAADGAEKNRRWRVLINEAIELDA